MNNYLCQECILFSEISVTYFQQILHLTLSIPTTVHQRIKGNYYITFFPLEIICLLLILDMERDY
jgi:hypothetical protein